MKYQEQNKPMDGIRMLADRMDETKDMSIKDVKSLIHSVCGYAECLMNLEEMMRGTYADE